MFSISIAVSLCLLAIFCALAKSRFGGRGVFWLSAGLALAFAGCDRFALASQAAVTALATVGCLRFRIKPKAVMCIATIAMVIGYGILFLAKPRLLVVWKLRHEFPMESMADRLAYEAKHPPISPAVLAPAVEERLASAEKQHPQGWERGYGLELLHSNTIGDFVLANGFGAERMEGYPYPGDVAFLERPVPSSISLPQAPEDPIYDPAPGEPIDVAGTRERETPGLPERALVGLHERGTRNFAGSGRNGFVKDKHHVAGFKSHSFTKVPELTAPAGEQPAPWRIIRLELISLLKHKIPMAYVSKHLPQMDELRDAPTRALEEFEQQALDRIRSDEDLVIDETPDRIRMLGSLRAARNCLDCHSVRRGDILGAFTYELVPMRPTRKGPPQEPVIN